MTPLTKDLKPIYNTLTVVQRLLANHADNPAVVRLRDDVEKSIDRLQYIVSRAEHETTDRG